ncbi:MAG TPA: MarR family transcriptional regulator [Ramlibacter sp.]|nr:MarR family transcriptional regulator [Ramlibacter sp.]
MGRVKASASDASFIDDYLPALLGQASALISSEFHRVVKDHGMSVSEWRVLASLAPGEPVSTGKLAQVSLTKGPTATRLLDRIENRGLVQRLSDSTDRRLTLVRITPKGQRTVSRLIALAKEHERRVLEPFGLQEAERLKSTLRRLIELHQPGEAEAVSADAEE